MIFFKDIDKNKLPSHIAFIMDGNGRWAKRRLLPRNYGHSAGVLTVERIVKYSLETGIKILTFFAFSTENWKRPKEEIDGLFQILRDYLKKKPDDYLEKGIRFNILGDIEKLPDDLKDICLDMVKKTKNEKKMILNIALNYGSRNEVLRAAKLCVEKNQAINEKNFESNLYTAGQPDPDLIIRTSGEVRLSNFLLYQSAYSELYFTKVLWPSFSVKEYKKAIIYFQNKNRRFGDVK